MSYFFRLRRLLPNGRERISAANPWHDEIGRFTTAANAVMFVRPKSGYHGNDETIDPNWRGRYAEGERYAPRRRSQADSDASFERKLRDVARLAHDPETKDQMSLGLPVPPQASQPSVPVAQPAPGDSEHSPSFNALKSTLSGVVTGEAWLGDIAIKLETSDKVLSAEVNGKKGINDSLVITTHDGTKFQLKHVSDDYGIGAQGEELGPRLIKELGIDVRVQEAAFLTGVNGREYALTEWVDGGPASNYSQAEMLAAVESTGVEEVAKLVMFEALAGDSDKHRNNYVVSDNGTLVGMDYSRMGDYNSARGESMGYQSVVLNTMATHKVKISTDGFPKFLERAYEVVKREIIPRVPKDGGFGRGRTPSANPMFVTSGRDKAMQALDGRFAALQRVVTGVAEVSAKQIRDALTNTGDGWAYVLNDW